jgi:hypothetical protein
MTDAPWRLLAGTQRWKGIAQECSRPNLAKADQMATTHPDGTADVTLPDTKLAREATVLIRDTTTDLIHHHSRRHAGPEGRRPHCGATKRS